MHPSPRLLLCAIALSCGKPNAATTPIDSDVYLSPWDVDALDVGEPSDIDVPDISDSIEETDVRESDDVLGPSATDPLARRADRTLESGPVTPNGSVLASDTLLVCDGARIDRLSLPGLSPVEGGAVALPGRCLALAATVDGDAIASVNGGRWIRVANDDDLVATDGPDAMGLTVVAERVWAAAGSTGLASAPVDLSAAATVHGLAKDARAVIAIGETLYVADGRHGVKRFSVDGAGEPSLVASRPAEDVDTALAVLDDQHLVVARGGAGIGMLDISGDGLELVGILELPGLASSVAVNASGVVMVASWMGAFLVDATNVGLPRRLAREHFDDDAPGSRRAIGVIADGDDFLTIGLDHVTRLAVNPALQVPELRLGRSFLHIDAKASVGKGESTVVVRNEGTGTLELRQVAVANPAFTLSLSPSGRPGVDLEIPSEEAGTFSVRSPGTASESTAVSFASNDPDHAEVTIPVSVNPARLTVGQAAPVVVLPELSGRVATLAGLRDPSGGTDPNAPRVVYIKSFSPL